MKHPKITIVIPLYNVESYIAECLQSVMRQTYQGPIECILVDDCSTDNSVVVAKKMIAEYEGTVAFSMLNHEKNMGVSCARNSGVDAASGDYVFFLDSDDVITDDCIEVLTSFSGNYDVIVGNYEYLEDRSEGRIKMKNRCFTGEQYVMEYLNDRSVNPEVWNKLFSLRYLKDNNLKFVPDVLQFEDTLFTFNFTCFPTRLCFVNVVTYYYRSERAGSFVYQLLNDNKLRLDALSRFWLEASRRCDRKSYKKVQEKFLQDKAYYIFVLAFEFGREVEMPLYKCYYGFRREYPFKPMRLWLSGEESSHWYKTRLIWSLPPLLGCCWLYMQMVKRKMKKN